MQFTHWDSDQTRKWDISDPKAVRLTQKTGVDSQPFSIVDNSGFVGVLNVAEPRNVVPSRKFIADKIVLKFIQSTLATKRERLDCGQVQDNVYQISPGKWSFGCGCMGSTR